MFLTFLFFFFICSYVCILFLTLWFQCFKQALMGFYRHFSSVCVVNVDTLWTWLLFMDELCIPGSDALLHGCAPSSWEQCRRNICSKPWLTSSFQSNVESQILCTRFTGNNQLQKVSWLFTAGTVSTSFNSSVQCSENTPKVWWSMQLIYFPYKCNSTDIRETPHIMNMDHLTVRHHILAHMASIFHSSCFILIEICLFSEWHSRLWFMNC